MDQQIKLHTEVVIDAAHYLRFYQGVCQRLHGHSWRVRIWIRGLSSDLDELGILYDFTNVKRIKDMYDHLCFNDVPPFNNKVNPTAEHIAIELHRLLKEEKPGLEFCVRVYETSIGKETWAQTGDWDEQSG